MINLLTGGHRIGEFGDPFDESDMLQGLSGV